MNPVTAQFIMTFGTLLAQYGIPAAIQIVAEWRAGLTGEPTVEDIRRLHDLVPRPETYFEVGD